MDEQAPRPLPALPGAGWGDGRWLALLLLFAAGLRAWQLTHNEVPSRDAVGFLRIAWRLGHDDWRPTLRSSHQHPGYPLAVLAVSGPLESCCGDTTRALLAAAHLVNALAGVLLVVPVFYLGKELFDRRVGFWAALLFQCLPAVGSILGDALSEGLFLLFAASSLALGARALRTGSPALFVLCGLTGGLAYLTRVEGGLVVLCVGLVLLGMQAGRNRRPWPECLRRGALLSAGALVVAAPYMAAIGGPSSKPTFKRMTHTASAPPAVDTSPLPFAVWNYGPEVRPEDRYGWAWKALLQGLAKGFFYALWAPGLLGLFWFRDRFRAVPGAWAALLVAVILSALLYRVAQSMGYLGARHLALVVLVGMPWVVAGLGLVAQGLSSAVARRQPEVVSLALLLLAVAAPLPRTLAPLHPDRVAFRQAGAWLAQHAGPDDEVVDPYGWAELYSGHTFRDGGEQARVCYVVLDESDNPHPHLWHTLARARALAAVGERQTGFASGRKKHPGEVVVYKVVRR